MIRPCGRRDRSDRFGRSAFRDVSQNVRSRHAEHVHEVRAEDICEYRTSAPESRETPRRLPRLIDRLRVRARPAVLSAECRKLRPRAVGTMPV